MSLLPYGFWYGATQLRKNYILPWYPSGEDKETRLPTKVVLVLPMGIGLKTPLNHVLVCVVSGVLYGGIL